MCQLKRVPGTSTHLDVAFSRQDFSDRDGLYKLHKTWTKKTFLVKLEDSETGFLLFKRALATPTRYPSQEMISIKLEKTVTSHRAWCWWPTLCKVSASGPNSLSSIAIRSKTVFLIVWKEQQISL